MGKRRLNLVARITQPIDQLEVTQEGDIRVDAKHWSANADSASLQGGEGGANMRLPCLPWISELPECRTGLGIDHDPRLEIIPSAALKHTAPGDAQNKEEKENKGFKEGGAKHEAAGIHSEVEDAEIHHAKKKKPNCETALALHQTTNLGSEVSLDRQNFNWSKSEAMDIIGETLKGEAYFVKRDGLGYENFGVIDRKKALPPPTREKVNEYKLFQREFSKAVAERTSPDGVFDLGELEEGSPLEMCYLLGKLREVGGPLHNFLLQQKRDVAVHVPILGLSFIVQRLLNIERSHVKRLKAELEQVKGELKSTKAIGLGLETRE